MMHNEVFARNARELSSQYTTTIIITTATTTGLETEKRQVEQTAENLPERSQHNGRPREERERNED